MIRLTSVSGNLRGDTPIPPYTETDGLDPDSIDPDQIPPGTDTLTLSRTEMQKRRLKGRTAGGASVMITLSRAATLKDGDILESGGSAVAVLQKPELTGLVHLHGIRDPNTVVRLGHMLGSMHRDMVIRDGNLVFPLNDPSDVEYFQSMLDDGERKLQIQAAMRVIHSPPDTGGHH